MHLGTQNFNLHIKAKKREILFIRGSHLCQGTAKNGLSQCKNSN